MKYQRTITGAALLLASVGLAACGSADDGGEAENAATTEEQNFVEIQDQPGSVEDYVGAMDDAELETCSASGNGLDVPGTVTNPESDAQEYRIYVSAMAAGDTVGLVQVDVADVAGGQTTEWGTQMELTQEDIDCVLRVERFSAE